MGTDVIDIDLADVETEHELHELLARRLAFPTHYGYNWDAFWDCIRDPEQSTMPRELRLHSWRLLHKRLPVSARKLRACLLDLGGERPDCRVNWQDPSGD